MDNGLAIRPLFFAIGIIVALVVGFAAGNSLKGQGDNATAADLASTVGKANSLTVEDKNFIVTVANMQIEQITQATALQSASVDWCTANGGQWLIVSRDATVNVPQEQAQQLRQQGANVQQLQDGNFAAAVVLNDRGSCIAVPTSRGG